jgi:integrase
MLKSYRKREDQEMKTHYPYLKIRGGRLVTWFLHPITRKFTRKSVCDISDSVTALKVSGCLVTLMRGKEWWDVLRYDSAKQINRQAADIFYVPIIEAINNERDFSHFDIPPTQTPVLVLTWNSKEQEVISYKEAAQRLMTAELTVENHQRALANLPRLDCPLNIKSAYEWWKSAGLDCKSPKERQRILTRVKHCVDKIGEKEIPTLTQEDVRIKFKVSEGEQSKRTRDLRRMLRDVQEHFEIKSLKPIIKSMHYQSPLMIGRKTEKVTLEKKILMEFLGGKSPIYWRALIGFLAGTGARLAEAAACRWEDVDTKKRLVRIQPTDAKPELKTSTSSRFLRPMDLVWPLLTELKLQTGKSIFLFPRLSRSDKPILDRHWIIDGHADALSMRLGRLDTKLGRKIPMRARRFYETEMLVEGWPSDLVGLMTGHGELVQQAHYVRLADRITAFR